MRCDPPPEHPLYASLVRRHSHEPAVTAGGDGVLWLLVGTDSGFESITALYYQRIDVELSRSHGSRLSSQEGT